MSTLLTPIITQIELDRDRFKDLVNGDETVSVSLENRTEKSIAGQVKDRIDAMSITLTNAIDASETARDQAQAAESNASTSESNASTSESNAFNYRAATEAARDLTLTYRNDTETFYNNTNTLYSDIMNAESTVTSAESTVTTLATQTEDARDQAIAAKDDAASYASVLGAAAESEYAATPQILYPKSMIMLDETIDTPLVTSVPYALTDQFKFSLREFEVEEYDTGTSSWLPFQTYSSTNINGIIPSSALDPTKEYRWRVFDNFRSLETNAPKSYVTKKSEWVGLYFDQSTLNDRVAIDIIQKPTITTTDSITNSPFTITLESDAFSATSATHRATVWAVLDAETKNTVYQKTSTTDLLSHTVEKGYLQAGRDYIATCRYVGDLSSYAQSHWGDFLSFTTTSEYYDDTAIQGDVSTLQTDVGDLQTDKRDVDDIEYIHSTTATSIDTSIAKAFTVDRTANPSLTLSTSATANRFIEVFVYVTGASGTVTWPGNINWDTESIPGGSAPTNTELGTNWSVVSLQKFDSDWVGRIVSKG